MRIAIIGTGYVGLVSGTCFAELGHTVTCVDAVEEKITALNSGKVPIFEPGLSRLISSNTEDGRLFFTSSLEEACEDTEAVFIAVGTPPDGTEGGADLSFVYAATQELCPLLRDGMLVVTKSTVPVGTGEKIKNIIDSERPELGVHVVSNPEFLREGCAVNDFLFPDRVLVGLSSPEAEKAMQTLYRPLTDQNVPLLITDIPTAELTKYAANAYLATKIAFINEMSDICEKVDANVKKVAEGMGMDHRIGKDYLFTGPGFGGSCFPKDTLALRKIARDANAPSQLVESVIKSNNERKEAMVQKIITAAGGELEGKRVGVLGLAFKADTDDMRESASLVIIPALLERGAEVQAFDPEAIKEAKHYFHQSIDYTNTVMEAARDVDILVIITEWNAFRTLNLPTLKQTMKTPIVVDLRNLYDPIEMQKAGITYHSIGRRPAIPE